MSLAPRFLGNLGKPGTVLNSDLPTASVCSVQQELACGGAGLGGILEDHVADVESGAGVRERALDAAS